MPTLVAGLLIAFVMTLAPSSLHARDDVEFGRYLGVRLQMWEESYAVLDKIIKSGSVEEAARAKSSKAEVMKAEADFIYAKDQDESARNDRYGEAVKIFGDPDTPAGIVSKGVMMLDLAMALRRSAPDDARKYCDDAIAMFDKKRKELDDKRFDGGAGEALFKKEYLNYSKIFYHYCRAFYVKGMTYELGSPDRESKLRECEKWIGEFLFSLDYPTEEQVLTYPLQGDIELARGRPDAAAAKFIDCVNFLSGESATAYIGRLAMEHGYLRAVELLTTELDFDPKNLQKCVELYAEAYAKYGGIPELDFYFKRFQLYRISALIKLGDESQIKGAIDLLFKLAGDKDINFRRQALVVLADIATRDNLDNELRFKCAGTVYAELDTNPVSVILKNIQAYQSLIVACSDVEKFETYAPACFVRIGEMYSRMWRFLDAALIYREACYRTIYFQEKFSAGSSVPSHMKGRCALITDGKSLNGFPGEMANQYARHASFLTDKNYGEPDNRYFQKLSDDANELKAKLSGEAARMELAFDSAKDLYDQKKYHQAAVRMVNLPASFRSYQLALYIGAKAYFNVSEDSGARRNNRSGEKDKENFKWDVEDPEWYQEQIARHKTDFHNLPAKLLDGVAKPHWDAILDPDTPDQLANWHKAVYYYKKYFLYEADKAWDKVGPLLEGNEHPTIADAIGAVAQARNAAWLRDNPGGEGEPDPDMKRMGYAAYDLAYLLRNPPKNLAKEKIAELQEQERSLALGILGPYWKWFGTHLAGSKAYQKGALTLSFYALADAKDEDACEEVYRAYVQAFPDDDKEIRRMVSNVYAILREKLTPKTNAMAKAASVLISRSNQLKKNAFERINAKYSDEWAKDAERLEKAKTGHEHRMILAEHFWQRWIVELLFEGDKNADVRENLPDLKATIQAKWDKMAEEYPTRWAKAVRAEYDTQMKKKNFAPLKAELDKAISNVDQFEVADKLQSLLDAETNKKDADNTKLQLLSDLMNYIHIATDELAYFTGTIFIYELGDFLDKLASDVLERARPFTTRLLKYYEEYRVRRGEGGPEGLKEEAVLMLGHQYFQIGDWNNTIKYLSNYVERFGGEKTWGKEESIPVDERNNRVGKTGSANELEVKYQLGKAYLELYKEDKDIEKLKKAALLMRRCWSFNLLRDANKKMNDKYTLLFQNELEDNYLYISNAMAEIFLRLHEAGDIKIDWPKYVDQSTRTLAKNPDHPLQDVPTDKASYLWEASQIRLKVWVQFTLLGRYQFRGDFRQNLEEWLKLIIQWLDTYGAESKGIEALKGDGLKKVVIDAYNTADREGALDQTYLPDSVKQYLDRIKQYGKRIDELAKKNKLK
ncbi:MAG: hypothetical protein KDB82_04755 [Planctomycetes bacterium]|nr:hypothetical protein [Planctomycetota bacterium]